MTAPSWRRSPFSTDLPRYVEYGGDPSCRHPADALDIRFFGFPLKADAGCLDEFCDRVFNHPSGGTESWKALGSHVLLNFVHTPSLGSKDPLDQWLGVVEEQETAIWVPVVDLRRGRMGWAIASMFVDSGMALVGGRETYGFPKQLGHTTVPRTAHAPKKMSVSAVTFKRHGPNERARRYEVLKAETPVTNLGPLDKMWDHPGDAFDDLVRLLLDPDAQAAAVGAARTGAASAIDGMLSRLRDPLDTVWSLATGVELALMLMHDLFAGVVPMVLLKQFRDAEITTAACYQAIVQVNNTVLGFQGGGFLPPGYEVTIADLAGEPIGRELGVALHQVPRVGFWLEFSFLVQMGLLLWEASPPKGHLR